MKAKRLLVLAWALMAAIRTFGQLESGEDIVISNKVNHDLYVAGGTVTINAPVHGDLIVAGGTVTINDTVTQDILVTGGTVMLNGFVKDDIRGAGGKIRFSQDIEGDVVAAGSTIQLDKDVSIMGNLYVSGGEVTLDGTVNGVIKSASGVLIFNGTAGHDIDCRGGKLVINGTVNGRSILAANEIELGPQSRFNNNVRYWNKAESLDFKTSVHNGEATLDPTLKMEDGKWHFLGFGSLLMVLWYLGTALVMISLAQYLFKSTFRKAADTVKDASLRSLGLGFLFLVGAPLAVLVCLITIVGLPIAILMMIAYITVLLSATVIVALLVAHWINNTNYNAVWSSQKIVFAAFGIFIFLKLASMTPFVGPLIMVLLACMSFGGIIQNIHWKRNEEPVLR